MIPVEERKKILAKVEKTVQAGYYAPDFNGKHWDQIVRSHREAILNAPTIAAFESKMEAMLADLDSTMGLLGPNSKITPRNAINASFHSVDVLGKGVHWAFQDIAPGGVAQRCGVEPADVLLTIDGIPALPSERPAFVMDKATHIEVLRGNERKQIHLDLKTPSPKYEDNPYSEPTSVTGSMTTDRMAIVKISLFPGKIGIDFANALSHLFYGSLAGAERLLLDLRGNPGGGIGNLRLMSLFTPRRQPIGYSLDRVTAERGISKDRLPRFAKLPSTKWELIPLAIKFGSKKSVVLETEGLGPKPFHGHIVVLVNEHTTGAAEMATLFAKENSLATIVGTKTPGRLISRTGVKVGAGYQLVYPVAAYQSWNGTRIQGRGIEPDVDVAWSFEDAQRGIDNQFNRALEVVRA